MKYRKFGKLDWQGSALGFGAMRLPTHQDGSVNEPLAIELLRYAIDQGVNYIDTAYPYHSQRSEIVVGKALQHGYRAKVRLATKLNSHFLESADDFDPMLHEQLTKLQTDHIDFYLLHGMRKARWETLREWGVLDWLVAKRAEGLIRYLGFSFHDSFDVFKDIVDAFAWDFCQVQYNFLDVENQAGRKGVEYAGTKGLGVVVMEPLLGGNLVVPPAEVQETWDSAPVKRSPVEWALQWLWDQPEVSVVLSGMNALSQIKENLACADRSGVGSLSDEEKGLLAKARETYQRLQPIPCTRCQYCMPCPNGVNIPNNFRWFNTGVVYNQMESARARYERMPEDQRASACITCRQCEDLCPQEIPIGDWMPEVDEVLGHGKAYKPAR